MTPVALAQDHIHPAAKLFANREDLIRTLKHKMPTNPVVAELGVAFGDFSKFLLGELTPSEFHAHDYFNLHEVTYCLGRRTADVFGALTHILWYQKQVQVNQTSRIIAFQGDSANNLSRSSAIYDLIYIDAGHSLESVKADAEAALRKVKESGILVFNDYIIWDHFTQQRYGVVDVVNVICHQKHYKILAFALNANMLCDVALSRYSVA